jgi:hypothetical protein
MQTEDDMKPGTRLITAVAALALIMTLGVLGPNVLARPLALAPGGPEHDTNSPDGLASAFTYQGRLEGPAGDVNGNCDFQFGLFDASSGGSQIGTTLTLGGVSVSDGLFTVLLDFGAGAFDGSERHLEVAVRCPAGSGTFTTLTPRQALTATPYALYADSANWSGLAGIPPGFADGTDDEAVYSAGAGLVLTGTTFSLSGAFRLPQGCGGGQIPLWDGNAWVCAIHTLVVGSDCTAIQQAIDALPSAGGRVTVPAGTYTCATAVVIDRDNVVLSGHGPATVLRLANGANAPVLVLGQTQTPPTLTRSNIRVANLTIDGNRQNQTQECWGGSCDTGGLTMIRNNGLTLRHVSDVVIENITIVGARSGGLVTEKDSRRVTVRGLTASDNEFDGLAGYQTEDSLFTDLQLYDNAAAGLSLDLNFDNNIVGDAVISGSGTVGVFMVGAHDNVLSGLQIRSSGQHAIFLAQGNTPAIAPTGNIFSDLVVAEPGSAGFCVDGVGWVSVCVNNPSVTDNVLVGAQLLDNGNNCIKEAVGGLLQQTGVICR